MAARTPVVRRAGEPDADELARMLTGLTDVSLYFRFQTAIGRPPRPALLLRMLCPAGTAFVATHDETIVGHAMWAWAAGEPAADGRPRTAELAAIIAELEQCHGLGIRMFSIAAAAAIAGSVGNTATPVGTTRPDVVDRCAVLVVQVGR